MERDVWKEQLYSISRNKKRRLIGLMIQRENTREELEMNQMKKASKLAVVCYSFGDLASQFVWTFVGSYLTIFYTDIVGLAPVAISAIMLGGTNLGCDKRSNDGGNCRKNTVEMGKIQTIYCIWLPILSNLRSVNVYKSIFRNICSRSHLGSSYLRYCRNVIYIS